MQITITVTTIKEAHNQAETTLAPLINHQKTRREIIIITDMGTITILETIMGGTIIVIEAPTSKTHLTIQRTETSTGTTVTITTMQAIRIGTTILQEITTHTIIPQTILPVTI